MRLIHGRIINHHGIDVITASLKGVVSLAEIDMISQLRDELDMAEGHKERPLLALGSRNPCTSFLLYRCLVTFCGDIQFVL